MLKPRLSQRKLLLLMGVIIFSIVVILGTAAWMKYSISNEGEKQSDDLSSIEDIERGARDFVEDNDIDGGLKYYDEQIAARVDDAEKRSLLFYKANFAQKAERFDEAVAAAEQADSISSDAVSAEAMARAYEVSGNKEQALVYYRRALELSPKEGMGARYNPVLEEIIKGLEQ